MAASELGSALARRSEKERVSESEWEGAAGARPSCLHAGPIGLVIFGVQPPRGGHGLAWSATDAARIRGHQSPACMSDRTTL